MMKLVVVTGGRDYGDYQHVARVLSGERQWGQLMAVVQGGARGADALAKRWCEDNGVPCFECKANWNVYHKRAGHVRNGWMLGLPISKVIAFPGGRGTKNAIDQAYQRGLEVQIERPTEHEWYNPQE